MDDTVYPKVIHVRFVSLLVIYLFFGSLLQAQERCGTVQYMQQLLNKKGIQQNTEQFEQRLQTKLFQRKLQLQVQRVQAAPYKIPVVIHVIHNGESEGTGINISDAQILSQITVLNNDFMRLNADATDTPAEYLSVTGSLDIEFVLAKQTPDGLCTNGIVRVNGGKSSWAPFDEALNGVSYWPSEDYLNIWVTKLSNSFLGYAQFPVSNLPGLEEFQDGLAPTDGVVIDYTVFGVGSSDPQYNLGRTVTHEVGHFFGLRHIWGDESGCSGTDYVNDTPNQEDETYNCPTHPQFECSNNKMFQNFLDYTDDVCMNLFTQGQADRMSIILDDLGIPRRNSLLTSHGLNDPVTNNTIVDIEIKSINQPGVVTCNSNPNLILLIKNFSCPIITSTEIEYSINGGPLQTKAFAGLNILTGLEETINLGPIDLVEGENTISVRVSLANGEIDANPSNSDTLIKIILNPESDFIPLRETFNNNSLNSWTVANPQSGILWNAYQDRARFPSEQLGGVDGEESWLVSPVLDFSTTNEASLFFDLTYAWDGLNSDRLRLLASTDCGDSYSQQIGFDKAGSLLSSNGDRKYISLSSLAGLSDVRIAFVATNRLGSNIDIDEIEFFISDDPTPINPENKLFAIYWNYGGQAFITFNLPERQSVGYAVLDMMGQQISATLLPDMLNQTIPVTGINTSGIYIIRLRIGKKYYATKIYLSP